MWNTLFIVYSKKKNSTFFTFQGRLIYKGIYASQRITMHECYLISRVCAVSKLFEIIKKMMVRMMIVMINMKFLGYWQKLVMFFGGS